MLGSISLGRSPSAVHASAKASNGSGLDAAMIPRSVGRAGDSPEFVLAM